MADNDRSYPRPGDPDSEMPPELRAWVDQYIAACDDNTTRYVEWTPSPTHDYSDQAARGRSN